MLRVLLVVAGTAFLAVAAAAADAHRVSIRVEPPQAVSAIVVRGGQVTQAVTVRNGTVEVPSEVPLPWSLGMVRFEADPYTRADLEQKRPWVIRELGMLRGRLERPAPAGGQRFQWLLQPAGGEGVIEREVTVDERGAFTLSLPAGTYIGAALSAGSATRIRSGIVVKPGQITDLGVLAAEQTASVSLRVVDANSGEAVAGARVTWDPPGDMLNATPSRTLFARRWSGVTNRYGVAEIPSVGPLPHSVRWRIEAKDYAPTHSIRLQLKEHRRLALPDVALRQTPAVIARVAFPRRDEESLTNCTLVAGEIRDPHSPRFEPVSRTKLREGDSRFEFRSYGRKRLWIENASKKTIFYRDFEVTSETTLVDLTLRPLEIHGRVTHRGKGLEGALVTLADPHNGSVILAQAPSDDHGHYRLITWQSGKLRLYTINPKSGPGTLSGNAAAEVDATDRREVRVDLAMPDGGFAIEVVDAATAAPLQARIQLLALFADGGARMSMKETDHDGRLVVDGFEEGKARLHVEADGYRTADVELTISAGRPEATVRLERAKPIAGRVVTAAGLPVAGAKVFGGYSSELADFGFYSASTDADGRFHFKNPPDPRTLFYVVAPGYALAMTTLRSDQVTTVVLQPPATATVTLREGNAPPEKVFLVMAAPRGGEYVPLDVVDHMAEVNGMDLYQLAGTSVDGDVILPQFLAPGTYELFLARRGGSPFRYERVGVVTAPLARDVVLSLR